MIHCLGELINCTPADGPLLALGYAIIQTALYAVRFVFQVRIMRRYLAGFPQSFNKMCVHMHVNEVKFEIILQSNTLSSNLSVEKTITLNHYFMFSTFIPGSTRLLAIHLFS